MRMACSNSTASLERTLSLKIRMRTSSRASLMLLTALFQTNRDLSEQWMVTMTTMSRILSIRTHLLTIKNCTGTMITHNFMLMIIISIVFVLSTTKCLCVPLTVVIHFFLFRTPFSITTSFSAYNNWNWCSNNDNVNSYNNVTI